MSRSWHQFLKSTYRKEPISSFILTVGAVDAVIGGVGDRWSLMTVGVGLVGVAIAVRWLRFRQPWLDISTRAPIHYLPSRSSRTALPMLSQSRKQPPH
ncbi:MAG TPA: hypothetical protein V6C78_24475 [Crinalium sp.]